MKTLHRFALLTTAALFLIACAGQPNSEISTQATPSAMMEAARAGDLGEVKSLVRQGETINVTTPEGNVIDFAAAAKQREVMIYLLGEGADPNVGNDPGRQTALMMMARAGDTQAVRALLIAGADVNFSDVNGRSAISYAAGEGNLATAKTLVKGGANVNIFPQGRSLLMDVVANNDLLTAQMLINAGADVNYVAPDGSNALKEARERGLRDLEMLLLQSGAKVY